MRTIALDFETTGLNVHKDNVFNIGAFDGTLELDLFINSYGGEQIKLEREIYDLTGINTQILNSTECRAESRRIQFQKLQNNTTPEKREYTRLYNKSNE